MVSHKTPVGFWPSALTSLTSWCAPFCRSKICLACGLLSSVISLMTPNILQIFLGGRVGLFYYYYFNYSFIHMCIHCLGHFLKIFLTTWGPITSSREPWRPPPQGRHVPLPCFSGLRAGGIHYLRGQQWTPNQKLIGNEGKGASPCKHHRGPG
jgi:hypothetical protein